MTDPSTPAAIDRLKAPLVCSYCEQGGFRSIGFSAKYEHNLLSCAPSTIKALREREKLLEAELTSFKTVAGAAGSVMAAQQQSTVEMELRAEAAEAHTVELAGALRPFADAVFNDNHEMTITPVGNRAYINAYFVLAATPAETLERARAKDEILFIAREIVSTESAWTSEWVAKDRALGEAFGKLDALDRPAQEDTNK